MKDFEGSAVMDWGKRMEPAIRQWYSDQTGRSVRLPDKILYHPVHQFMLASLDGFTDDNRVVEIKTARYSKDWGSREQTRSLKVICAKYSIIWPLQGFR